MTRNEEILGERIEILQEELAQLRELLTLKPVDYGRPTGGGSIDFAVARKFPTTDLLGVGDELECSIISYDDGSSMWQIPTATLTTLKVEPNLIASMYEFALFPGTGSETFPFNILPGTLPLPVFLAAGRRTIMHHSRLFYGEIEEGAPVTEGFLVNGKGEVQFGNG